MRSQSGTLCRSSSRKSTRKDAIIYPSKLPIRSGPHVKVSPRRKARMIMADEIKAVPAEGSNDPLVGAQKGAPVQSGAPYSLPEVTYVTAKDVGLILPNKHSAPPPPLTPAQPATPPAPPAPAPETFLAPVRSAPTPTKGNPLAPMSNEMPADDSAPDEN